MRLIRRSLLSRLLVDAMCRRRWPALNDLYTPLIAGIFNWCASRKRIDVSELTASTAFQMILAGRLREGGINE